MTDKNTCIVVGAGHNGLTCATYLARGGKNVVVLEANEQPGGCAATREFASGYQVSACAHFLYQLQPEVVADLELERYGLKTAADGLVTIALAEDGAHARWQGGEIFGGASARDRDGLREFHRLMTRFASFLRPFLNKPPPLLKHGGMQDKLTLARFGLDLRRLGKDDMRDFLRVIAINIYDVLNEHLDSDRIKGGLALDAVLGTHLGPRSPNSVLTYLYRLASAKPGAVAQPAGGMGSVGRAFAAAAEAAGVTVRTGARVKRIVVDGSRATGVELEHGEILEAATVISNADPITTVMDLVGARHFETGFVRRINNVRMRGNASKLHLALDELPKIAGLKEADYGQRLLIAGDMDYVERAFNPAKYGECSPEPVLEISFPTANDPSLAPAQKHVMSAVVQYTPHARDGAWDDGIAQEYADVVIDRIARFAPDIRNSIVASEFLSPVDLQQRYRVYGGHWHHGEMALDQFLFVRPVAGAAQYALPLDGLYLCGAGAHPGGGLSGAAGRNAAQALLKKEANA